MSLLVQNLCRPPLIQMLCSEDIDSLGTWKYGIMLSKGLQIRFSYALLVFEFWVADKVPQWLGHLLVTSASPVALIGQGFQETEATKRCQWKLHSWNWKSMKILHLHQDFRCWGYIVSVPRFLERFKRGRVWPCLRNFRTDLPWSSVLILWFNMIFLLPPEPEDTRCRRWPTFSLHVLPSCKANRDYNRFQWSTSQHILGTSSKQH